jgi:outer membrane autotransporter protein
MFATGQRPAHAESSGGPFDPDDRSHYAAQAAAAQRSNQLFINGLMTCPVTDGVKVFDRDGQCYWAQIKGSSLEWDQTAVSPGGSEKASGAVGGLQGALDRYWRLGMALSVENSDIKTDNEASSEGNRVQAAVMLKGSFDQTTLAASLFAGNAWYETDWFNLTRPGEQTAQGESKVTFGGADLRLSHSFWLGSLFDGQLSGWYLKPIIDVNAVYVSYGDLTETGLGAKVISDEGKWMLSVTPALETGGLVALDADTLLRPFVRAGVAIANDANFSLTSHAFHGSGSFSGGSVQLGDVYAQITVGMDIFRSDTGVNFSIAYDGQLGEHSTNNAGSVKLRIGF